MCDSSVNESLFTISVEDQDARAAAAEHSRWIVQEGNGEGAVDGRFVLLGIQDAVEPCQDARQQGRQDGIPAERTANSFHSLNGRGSIMLGRSAVEFHPYVSNTAIIINLAKHNICEISLPINLGDGSPPSEFCPFDFYTELTLSCLFCLSLNTVCPCRYTHELASHCCLRARRNFRVGLASYDLV